MQGNRGPGRTNWRLLGDIVMIAGVFLAVLMSSGLETRNKVGRIVQLSSNDVMLRDEIAAWIDVATSLITPVGFSAVFTILLYGFLRYAKTIYQDIERSSGYDEIKASYAVTAHVAAEILQRILHAIVGVRKFSFSSFLIWISGADEKFLSDSVADKRRYTTAGFIIVLVGMYTAFSVIYIFGGTDKLESTDKNAQAIATGTSDDSRIAATGSGGAIDANQEIAGLSPERRSDTPGQSATNPRGSDISQKSTNNPKAPLATGDPPPASSYNAFISALGSVAQKTVSFILKWHVAIVSCLLALFVVSIDRMIVANNDTEYKLFKIRYVAKQERWKSIPDDLVEGTSDPHASRILRYVHRAIQLALAAINLGPPRATHIDRVPTDAKSWFQDASSLFHLRAMLSIALTLSLRVGLAWLTAFVSATAFTLMFFADDIAPIVESAASKYAAELNRCDVSDTTSLGCQLKMQKNRIETINSQEKAYNTIIYAERNSDVVTAYQYIPKDLYSDNKAFNVIIPPQSESAIPDNERYHVIRLTSTGKRTGGAFEGSHEQKLTQDLKLLTDERDSLKKDQRTQELILQRVAMHKNGVSVRLEALESLGRQATSGMADSSQAPSHDRDGNLETSASAKFRRYLHYMLLAFELIPLVFLKIVPLLGWYPSRYIYRYSMDRIQAEQKLHSEDDNGVALFQPPMDAAGVFDALKRYYKNTTSPSSSAGSAYATDVSHHTLSQLIVVLMLALRLPMGIIAVLLLLLSSSGFDLIKSLWIFKGI